ncbi:MAG: cupin domain-containing protein [Proteobacteria bacterium]|nr:cupin domain-containing protein [Pseudomonadota bacterium]
MSPKISWDRLIGPIGVERFEAEYFGQKPLHLKQCFAPATGLESLEQWSEALRGQKVSGREHRGFVAIDPGADTAQGITPDLAARLRDGGPLIIDGINKINPAVQALALALARGLGSFVGVNAYISPHRKDALDLHHDDHDVIVLQLHGSKLWTLGSRLVRGVASSKFFQVDQAAAKSQAIEKDHFKTLETGAGDLLYLPRGLYHRATSNGPTSIHLSFGVRRPTGLDFVDLMMQRLIADTKTREYAPRLSPEDDDAAVRAYLDYVLQRIGTLADDPALRSEFLQQYRTKFDGVIDGG